MKRLCNECHQERICCPRHSLCELCDWPYDCFARPASIKLPKSKLADKRDQQQAGDTACTLLLIFAGFSLAVCFAIYFALYGFGELTYVLKELIGKRL